MTTQVPASVDECTALLRSGRYVSDRSLAVVLFLAMKLERPLFLEGEPGVGKTEIAKVLAAGLGRRLIRLQCHDGLDLAGALYEWNYLRQMLELRITEVSGGAASRETLAADIFDPRFLIRRPLLQALEPHAEGPPVLLIDEIDRADEPFEAFLLELLSDFQVTIPELGTVKADARPIVIVTSNRTREVHDALKRRCLYHWLGHPGVQRELEILKLRAPQVNEELAQQVAVYVNNLRTRRMYKPPGIAESLDWAAAIVALGEHALTASVLEETLGVLLKYEEDVETARGKIGEDLNALTLRKASMSR